MFDGINRRDMLRVGGAAGSLAMLGKLATGDAAAVSDLVSVPESARSVEGGLTEFVAKWNAGGPILTGTRFGRFLVNRTFNVHVTDGGRAWTVTLGPTGAVMAPGVDPTAHANVSMSASNWERVLYGDNTGIAPLLDGEVYPSKDEANMAVTLLLSMYVLAHVPTDDLQFTLENLRGIVDRQGLPSCDGEPPSFEAFEQLADDPVDELEAVLTGADQMPPVTKRFAEWTARLDYDDIPETQLEIAKRQLKGIVGVCYAGTTTQPGNAVVSAVEELAEPGGSTVIGGGYTTSARNAAMVNSHLSQVLEWEDWADHIHTGAAVVPVALAVADAERASGRELLTAIVAGNELLARVGSVMTDIVNVGQAVPAHQVGAPLVAGKLMGLDADELRDAVGIACTQPQLTSLSSWTAGAKGFITAEPAENGVRAARLAKAGLSGRRDQLEHPLGYFYRLSDVRTPRDFDAVVDGLGVDWRLTPERYFDKRYPVDGFTLTAVHAMLDIRDQLVDDGIDPADPDAIDSIRVHMNLPMAGSGTMFSRGEPEILDRVLDPSRPDWTHIPLHFDGIYPLAAALIHGELTHEQYTEDAIADPRIRALWPKFHEAPDLTVGVLGAEVSVTVDGSGLSSVVDLTDDDTYTAFVDCINTGVNDGFDADDKLHLTGRSVRSERELNRIGNAIDTLETTNDVRQFTALL